MLIWNEDDILLPQDPICPQTGSELDRTTVPPQGSFCTNASDALWIKGDAMASFRFRHRLICAVGTENRTIGIGNASLTACERVI